MHHASELSIGRPAGRQGLPGRPAWCVLAKFLTAVLFGLALGPTVFPAEEVPVVRGDLGPCSADFTVTDSAQKPLFDAKVHVTVIYGFMNKRKSEFEVGTNSEGKARIEGLPARVKRPLEFQIRHGGQSKSVFHDPASECHASFSVLLGAS